MPVTVGMTYNPALAISYNRRQWGCDYQLYLIHCELGAHGIRILAPLYWVSIEFSSWINAFNNLCGRLELFLRHYYITLCISSMMIVHSCCIVTWIGIAICYWSLIIHAIFVKLYIYIIRSMKAEILNKLFSTINIFSCLSYYHWKVSMEGVLVFVLKQIEL